LKTALASIKLLETTQIATKIIPQCSMLVLDKSTEVRNLALTLMDGSMARLRDYHESMIEAEREAKEEALAKKFPSTPSQSSMNTSGILSTPVAESIMNVGGWTSWLTSKQSESTLAGNSNVNIDNSMNMSNTLEPGSPGPSMANLNLGNNNSIDELDNTSKSTTSIKSLSLSNKSTSKAAVNNKGWDEDDFGFGNDDNTDNHKPKPQQNKNNNNTSNKGFDDFDDGLNFDDDDDEDNQQQQKNTAKKFSSSSLSAKANQEGGSEKSKSTKEKAKPAAKIAVKKLDFKKDDEAWEDF
jgi:hypothetical protein